MVSHSREPATWALALVGLAWAAYLVLAVLGAVGFLWATALRARRRSLLEPGEAEVVGAAVVVLALSATVAGALGGGVLAAFADVDAAYWGAAFVSFGALAVLGRRLAAL